MEDLLVKYGIVFAKRFTLKQRQRFLLSINEDFTKAGYKTKFANNDRKRNARAVNLFIGDIGEADTIICTHHDTPLKVFWPNYKYFPLNGQLSNKALKMTTLIPDLLATILGVVAILIYLNNPNLGGDFRTVWLLATVFLSFLFASLISRGTSNKYNINRNTAAILALLDTALKLNKKSRKKIAFILFDKCCSDNSGAQMLRQALPTTMDKKTFIYLDCIGKGDNLVIAHKERQIKESQRLLKEYKGSQNAKTYLLDDGDTIYTPTYFFKQAIIITSGNYDKNGNFYVDKVNSSADKFVDIPTIEAISSMLITHFNK